MVETMQFRTFVWRHNPEKITVSEPSQIAAHFCPGKGDVMQRLGVRARTVRCEGVFFGASFPEAMAQLQDFRAKTSGGERGILLVPGLPPFMALLRELTFDAVGSGKVIPYTMVFVEAKDVGA